MPTQRPIFGPDLKTTERTITIKYAISLALILSASTASADLWTWSKNAGLEPKGPDAAYRVETKGLDVRIYEWTPATAPHQTCIMAFGQTNPVGMQCFAKDKAADNAHAKATQ